MASEPRDRSAPAKRRARDRVGESEGRSPSEKTMSSVTGVEIGPDYCVLVRARRRDAAVEISAIRIFDSLEWSTDPAVQAGQLRDARRELSLPRRAAVVAWESGRARSAGSAESLLNTAGFSVERVLSPVDALAIMARSRATGPADGATAWLSLNHHGVALAVVRDGHVLESREFAWRIKASEQRVQANLLRRYLYVAQLVPELRHARDAIEKRYGTGIAVAITSGNVPDLRSLTMPLIQELDIEFETLDSVAGLKASGRVAAAVAQTAQALRLAAAAASEIDRSRWNHPGQWLGAAAALMLAAGVAVLGFAMWPTAQVKTLPSASPSASSPSPVPPPPVAAHTEATAEPVATSPPPEPAPAPRPQPRSAIGTRGLDRPDGGTLPPASADPLPSVGGVLISAGRRLAVVDGAVVGIGDKVGTRTVAGIESNAVVLREASGKEVRVPIRPRSGV
jgi:hypothetical protein